MTQNKTCYLCGEVIHGDEKVTDMQLSRDHVPPKQFYPESIRQQQNLNLEIAPSHRKCNEEYRKDEEYFYHSLFVNVKQINPGMGKMIWQDLKRRTHNPQTPAMIRKIMQGVSNITQGGIHLPPGKISKNVQDT